MNRKTTISLSIGVVIVVLLAGMYVLVVNNNHSGSNTANGGKSVTVTDMLGRTNNITIGSIDRVVAVGAGALRFVVYLNATDMIVGVETTEKNSTDYTGRTYFAANTYLANLTSVGPQFGGDTELIASVLPDVVFESGLTADKCDSMQGTLGVPVIALSSSIDLTTHYSDFCLQIRLIGTILQKDVRAESLIGYIDNIFEDISSRVANDTIDATNETAYIGGVSAGGYHGFDYTSYIYAPFVLADVNNVITGSMMSNKTVGQIDIEKVVALDPDIVFVDYGGYSLCKSDYAKFSDALNTIEAFENGRVYSVFPYNWYATNWDTVLVDCYIVAKIMHPSAFGDINISDIADKIWTFMVGGPLYDQMLEYYGPIGHISLA